MLRQFAVQIPRSQWPEITQFLSISLDELRTLAVYMQTAMPMSDVEDLAQACSTSTNVPVNVVETTLAIAINLSRLQRSLDKPPSEILGQVAEFLASAGFEGWQEGRSEAWHERQCILEQLIVPDGAIDLMSKVRELLYDSQCVFLNSTVLTDVRHIYNHDATDIKGGLVLHTLSLEYFEGHELRQMHIMLSSPDVEKLMVQLRRSQSKADVAMKLLENSGLQELTPKRNI